MAGGMSSKPECLFGLSCFRRNPDHYQRYHHNHLAALAATPEQDWGPAASEQLRAQVRVHRKVEGDDADLDELVRHYEENIEYEGKESNIQPQIY